MKPPRTTKLRVLRKILRRYGIRGTRQKTPGHSRKRHIIFEGPDRIVKYPVPDRGENADLQRSIINAVRRAFKLTPQHGITHREFYGQD